MGVARHLMRLPQLQALANSLKYCDCCDYLCNLHQNIQQQSKQFFILHNINQIINNSTMITQASNLNDSPRKSDPLNRDVPAQSIIRQVTTPYVLRQAYNSSQPPSFHITNPQPQIIQNSQQYSQINQGLISGSSQVNIQHMPLQARNSNLIQGNQAQFIEGHGSKQAVITNQNTAQIIQAELPPLPPPIRRYQYVPYEEKYIQYVQQKIKVPVQKTCTDYYRIEHVIEYVPIQKEEVVYELQPKEIVTMRLEYVPVQQKIIHISDKNAKQLGIKEYNSAEGNVDLTIPQNNPLYQKIEIVGGNVISSSKGGAFINSAQTGGFVSGSFNNNPNTASGIRRSRTNFVTSDGYDPQSNLQQIDRILTSSSVRASRAKLQA